MLIRFVFRISPPANHQVLPASWCSLVGARKLNEVGNMGFGHLSVLPIGPYYINRIRAIMIGILLQGSPYEPGLYYLRM